MWTDSGNILEVELIGLLIDVRYERKRWGFKVLSLNNWKNELAIY